MSGLARAVLCFRIKSRTLIGDSAIIQEAIVEVVRKHPELEDYVKKSFGV